MKRVIVNADDFGFSDHTYEWTVKGFECGALTSATIMAGMSATDKAVAFARENPQFSFGVHLYLVDVDPMCKPSEIPSMIDPSTGKMWVTRKFVKRNLLGLIRVDDLVREMRAQYLAIKNAGVSISHVDGHGHNHRLPQSIKALKILNQEFGFKRVRRCQDIYVGKMGPISFVVNRPMQLFLKASKFLMTDHFVINAGHSEDKKWFTKVLQNLPDGTTEIAVHPGVDEPWRTIDTTDCFTSRDWSGIEKITFNDL